MNILLILNVVEDVERSTTISGGWEIKKIPVGFGHHAGGATTRERLERSEDEEISPTWMLEEL